MPCPTIQDGRTHRTKIRTMPGGVGRNIAEALAKLNKHPLFISAIGDDNFGYELLNNFQNSNMESKGIFICENSVTAVYSGILTCYGELLLGLGDMNLHSQISPDLVKKHAEEIHQASIVILDGNLPLETISTAMELSCESKTPVWFEPTEVRKAEKILHVPKRFWSSLTYISPNSAELLTIAKGLPQNQEIRDQIWNIDLHEKEKNILTHCFSNFTGLHIILLTQGKDGFVVVTRQTSNELNESSSKLMIQQFPAPILDNPKALKSVSGAGDCLNAGFISGLLEQKSMDDCANRGIQCARSSLESYYNVPQDFGNF